MMARRIGLVTAVKENGMAEVVTDRKGGCGGCEQSHGCRSCLSGAKLVSSVQNPIGAESGDVVTIDLAGKGLWSGALLFYVFPVLCLIAGAGIGTDLRQVWFLGETSTPVVLGILGLGIGLLITVLISRSALGDSLLRPRITHIMEKVAGQSSGEKTTSKDETEASCCAH